MVQGLVQGLLEGNRLVRDTPDQYLDVIGRAFKWNRDQAKSELGKVHLANLPENIAFFSGAIDAAGSFESIYQSAVLAYGSDLIKDPPDAGRFASLAGLQAVEKGGLFKDQKMAIAPMRSAGGASLEADPLLSKDIRFPSEPNSSTLDQSNQTPRTSMRSSGCRSQPDRRCCPRPRGQLQDRRLPPPGRRESGNGSAARMALSKDRAVRSASSDREHGSIRSASRSSAAAGKSQPAQPELNRRVEVQWFTIRHKETLPALGFRLSALPALSPPVAFTSPVTSVHRNEPTMNLYHSFARK